MNVTVDNVVDSRQFIHLRDDRFMGVGECQVMVRKPYS